jgi:signal transduction histidine kinase
MRILMLLVMLLLTGAGMGYAGDIRWISWWSGISGMIRVMLPVGAGGIAVGLVLLVSYRVGATGWARRETRRRIEVQAAMADAQQEVVHQVQMLEHAHLKAMVIAMQRALEELRPGHDPEQQQLWVAEAQRINQRLLALVISLHEQVDGRVPESPVPTALDLSIRDVVSSHAATDRRCRYRYEVSGERQRVPEQVSRTLTLVLYNALTNAVRHAQAGQVTVQLAYEPSDICLSVQDNGCGFVAEEMTRRSSGRGLRDMEQVVTRRGGTLQVMSSPGRGTTIHAVMPLGVGTRKEQTHGKRTTPTAMAPDGSVPWSNGDEQRRTNRSWAA